MADHEKEKCFKDIEAVGVNDSQEDIVYGSSGSVKTGFWSKALVGVELRGFAPIVPEERKETQYFNVFSIWFCMSLNLTPLTTGMTGTMSYGLGLRDASLIILFFNLLATFAPAFFSTFGPKTGMRQMVQARFSFGEYLVLVPILLNLATLTGFCVIDSVIGGQTLSAVSSGSLSVNVGIVIIGIVSLLISFCGYRVLHIYERYAWIPAAIAIIITAGTGGKDLSKQVVPEGPATATAVLSFGSLVAGFVLPWAALAADFSTYVHHEASIWRIGSYTYLGLFLPNVLLMTLGAAMGGAIPNVESWTDGYNTTGAGGVLAAMLSSAGGFGKFIVVIHAFTLLGNISATFYAISLNFQMAIPRFTARIPRAVYSVAITAITIGVSVKAAVSFFDNLENFIGIIGYWAAAFIAVVLVEHFAFRDGDFASYALDAWDVSSMLPSGLAAIAASALSFGLVVPSMAQIWYTGPIAETTGDIGFELAFFVSAFLYLPFRFAERRIIGR